MLLELGLFYLHLHNLLIIHLNIYRQPLVLHIWKSCKGYRKQVTTLQCPDFISRRSSQTYSDMKGTKKMQLYSFIPLEGCTVWIHTSGMLHYVLTVAFHQKCIWKIMYNTTQNVKFNTFISETKSGFQIKIASTSHDTQGYIRGIFTLP